MHDAEPAPVDPGPTRAAGRGEPVVVITGASSGIGRAVALRYARRSAHVVLAARSQETLDDVARRCRRAGAASATPICTDVLDRDQVEELVAGTVTRLRRLDVVVHAAGVAAFGDLETIPPDVFDRVVETNVLGSANLARAVLPQLRRQGGGTLVLVGSLLGDITVPQMSPYVASKHAVNALVRILQQETRDAPGVRVCGIFPGSTRTSIYEQAANYVGRLASAPFPSTSAESVADKVVSLVDSNRSADRGTVVDRVISLGFHTVPWAYDALVGPLVRRMMLSGRQIGDEVGNVFASRHGEETEPADDRPSEPVRTR